MHGSPRKIAVSTAVGDAADLCLGGLAFSHWEADNRAMSQLDVVKEQIAYFKLWLGVMIVTDISLIGWFIGNYVQASISLLVTDFLAIAIVSSGIVVLHRRVEHKIDRLRDI